MAYTDPCSDGKRQQSADLKLQNFHKRQRHRTTTKLTRSYKILPHEFAHAPNISYYFQKGALILCKLCNILYYLIDSWTNCNPHHFFRDY